MTPEEYAQQSAEVDNQIKNRLVVETAAEVEAEPVKQTELDIPGEMINRTISQDAINQGINVDQVGISQAVSTMLSKKDLSQYNELRSRFFDRLSGLTGAAEQVRMSREEAVQWIGEFDQLPTPVGLTPRDMIEAQDMYVWGDYLTGRIKADQKKFLLEGIDTLLRLRQGWTQEELEQEGMGAVKDPVVDPVMFMVALALPGLQFAMSKTTSQMGSAGFKFLAKEATKKEALALIKSEMASQVFAETVATGFIWTAEEILDFGPIATALTGLIGTAGTSALMSLSHHALRTFIHSLRGRKLETQIAQEVSRFNDAFSTLVRKFLNEPSIETSRAVAGSMKKIEDVGLQIEMPDMVRKFHQAYIQQDQAVTERLANVVAGTGLPPEQIEAVRKVLGTDDFTETIGGLIPKAETVIPEIDLPQNMVVRPQTGMSRGLNNAYLMNQVAGYEIMYKQQEAIQKDVLDLIQTRVLPTRAFVHGADNVTIEPGNVKLGLPRFLSSPSYYFSKIAKELVKNPSLNQLEARRMKAAVNKGIKKIFSKDIDEKSKQLLLKIIHDSDDKQELFKVTADGLFGNGQIWTRDPDIIDRYFAYRMLDDHLGNILNQAKIRSSRAQGFKWYNNRVVKMGGLRNGQLDDFGSKWLTSMGNAGGAVVEFPNGKKMILTPGETLNITDIPDNANLLGIGKNKYHMARMYQDPWRVVKISTADKGKTTAQYIETGPTYRSVRDRVMELEELADETTHYVALKRNEVLKSTDVAKSRRANSFLKSLKPADRQKFKDALLELGLHEEDVGKIDSALFLRGVRQSPYTKPRSKEKLKSVVTGETAAIYPADEALSRYANNVIDSSSMYLYAGRLRNAWHITYRELIDPKTRELIDRADVSVENIPLWKEARVVKNQIDRVAQIPTEWELRDRQLWNNWAHKLYNSKWYNRHIGEAVDKQVSAILDATTFEGAARPLRFLTGAAKLGFWNIGQIVVQTTSGLNIAAHMFKEGGLEDIVSGGNDFLSAIMARGPLRWTGIKPSKQAQALWDALEHSGFIADLDFADLQAIYSGALAKGTWTRKVMRTGMWPFKGGEAMQRSIIWFSERRRLIREILDGKSTLSKFQIDSQEFLDMVNERAYDLALNMTRLDAAAFSRGPWGIPFQFKQFMGKQAELMLPWSKKLTMREKMGLYTAWGTAFGYAGIPGALDVMNLADYALAVGSNDPTKIGVAREFFVTNIADMATTMLEDINVLDPAHVQDVHEAKAWFERLMAKGITNATVPQFDIATRAGIGMFLDQFWYTSDHKILDLSFGASSGLVYQFYKELGALASRAVGGTKDSEIINAINILIEEENPNLFGPVSWAVKEFSGPRNVVRAVEALATGEVTTAGGQPVLSRPTLSEILLTGVGIQPARAIRVSEATSEHIIQSNLWKEWSKEKAGQVAELFKRGNPETGWALQQEYLEQIAKVPENSRLAQDFQAQVTRALMKNMIPRDAEVIIRATRRNYYPQFRGE